jgi:C_GCAxxG_C_C family probable redox protein
MGAGEVCGAVSGGALAIGLVYGGDYPDAVGVLTEEFMSRFAERNGAVRCIDLINFDISSIMAGDDVEVKNIIRLFWFFARGGKRICNRAVSSAVQVIMEQWQEWEEEN